MNFEETQKLLNIVNQFVSKENIKIQTNGNKDWRENPYTADFVKIGEEISFEVTPQEIIIFFFSDHIHFEDYSSVSGVDEPKHTERACEFLKKLFTLPIELKYTKKGDRITRSSSQFVISETEKESCAGVTIGFAGMRNLFKKKCKYKELKIFDKEKGCYLTMLTD